MAATEYYGVVQQIYVAYFGRPADPVGLANFATQLNAVGAPKTLAGVEQAYASNSTIKALIDQFGTSAESATLYAGASTAAFVNAIYTNVLNRAADMEGLLYWASAIDRGVLSRGKAALSIMAGAVANTSAQGVIDAAVVTNKITVATNFTTALDTTAEVLSYAGDTAAATARALLLQVNNTTDTTAFQSTVNSTIVTMGNAPVVGSTFTLTNSVDNVTGTSGNDTINAIIDSVTATNTTLSAGDKIAAGAGADTLNITLSGNPTATTSGADISGVETINVRNIGTGAAALDASVVTGLTTVNSDRSTGSLSITNLAAGAAAGVVGNGTVVNGVEFVAYATGATAATVNLSGGTKAATLATTNSSQVNLVGQTTLTSVTINSTDAANAVKGIYLNQKSDLTDAAGTASVTSATINAATNLDVSGQGITGFAGSAATITVSGAASSVKLGTIEAGTVKTIDASGLTAGGITATLNTAVTSVKGGAGADTITTAATTATGAVINAGNGTDTLVLAATNDVTTAAKGAQYTGFETLKSLQTSGFDASLISGITSLESAATGAGFTKLTAAQAANIAVSADQTSTQYALATATGTSDVLGLTLKASTASAEIDAGLSVAGFETLNLTVSSGLNNVNFKADGVTAAVAGTDYSSISISAATTDLKTVTVGGAYGAKVDISSNATKVTTLDASANTAGVDLAIGGQTGTLTVTGTAKADKIVISTAGTGGLQTVNAGDGNDSITAAQADIAVATINGGAGTDTLTVSDTGTVTINDNNFAGVTSIEKLVLSATTGLTFSVGGYANGLATANGGVLDVTAAALTGAATIDATGLSATNSLKLALTNVDAAANGTATAITLSQGADIITIKQAGASNTDTITISGGVAALASTAVKTVDLSGVTTGGAIAVTTGAGADVIKASGLVGTYTAGAGADTITLVASDGAAQTLKYDVANQSTTTAFDKVSNFQMVATNGDLLDFAGTPAVLTTAQLGATGWTVSSGIATKTGGTLADFITAFAASTTAGVVAFSDGTDTYVAYSDGTAATTTSDQIVELVGVTGATSVSTTVGANVIGIV